MSNFTDGSQIDIRFPENLVIPTYFTNLLMANILQDEVYLRFCLRSVDRPLVHADLQCRVVASVAQVRKMAEGLGQLLAQYDQEVMKLQAQKQGAKAMQSARAQAGQAARPDGTG